MKLVRPVSTPSALFILVLITGAVLTPQETSNIVSTFLPPRTQIEALDHFDSKTGKKVASAPAALAGHFTSPQSDDIVFAYSNTTKDEFARTLFIAVLHKGSDGYVKIFEKSYYEERLWVQDFSTIGLRIVHIPGDSTDSIAITTAAGASIGARLELYRWQDGLGMTNVMPIHKSFHHVEFVTSPGQFIVRLSFEKYPGEKGVPMPISFRWDGHQMVDDLAKAVGRVQ